MESDFDPEKGFTVSFTHIEQSGYYDCKVVNNEDHSIQYHVMVNANCELSICDKFGDNVANTTIESLEFHFGDGSMLLNINNSIGGSNSSKVSKISKRMNSEQKSHLNGTDERELMKRLEYFIAGSQKKLAVEGLCCC